jgi:hypothetical protein
LHGWWWLETVENFDRTREVIPHEWRGPRFGDSLSFVPER